jgi:hypothetical protein
VPWHNPIVSTVEAPLMKFLNPLEVSHQSIVSPVSNDWEVIYLFKLDADPCHLRNYALKAVFRHGQCRTINIRDCLLILLYFIIISVLLYCLYSVLCRPFSADPIHKKYICTRLRLSVVITRVLRDFSIPLYFSVGDSSFRAHLRACRRSRFAKNPLDQMNDIEKSL